MNSSLGELLLVRVRNGDVVVVRHATVADLAGFVPRRNDCHGNVGRWCEGHPDHRRSIGWIISATGVFDRHSVVDLGPKGLLDITPLPDRTETHFLPHPGDPTGFDRLPNQVIVVL